MSFYSLADQDIDFLPAEEGGCPVCKDSTGNCTGDSEYHGAVFFKPPRRPDPAETFSLPERVYEEVVENGKKVKRLLYAKGTRVRPAEAKRLGFLK